MRTAASSLQSGSGPTVRQREVVGRNVNLLMPSPSPGSGVILMTAHGTPEVTKGALDLGAYQVMHKPFELHDLEPLLLRAFASSASRPSRPR